MTDKPDPPIEPLNSIAGVKVVDIGDVRVSRGMTRRHSSSCPHRQLIYDGSERRIWCKDCEKDVEPFDAFEKIVAQLDRAHHALHRREQAVKEAETFNVRTLAAKSIDKAWRSTKMIPACPSCGMGLFPEDFKHGIASSLGREYALALRKRNQKK